jgi:hypothetical protein
MPQRRYDIPVLRERWTAFFAAIIGVPDEEELARAWAAARRAAALVPPAEGTAGALVPPSERSG